MWWVWVAAPVAVLSAAALASLIYYRLRMLALPVSVPGAEPAVDTLAVIKSTISVTAFVGAVLAGVYAYRKQRLSEGASRRADSIEFSRRYGEALSQMGAEHAAIRLGGVYAMARLADDWGDQRQTCIDVLCAYLRMPPMPRELDSPEERAEREVRATIQDIIAEHLRFGVKRQQWTHNNFDFTGAHLHNLNFGSIDCAGRVVFTRAIFHGFAVFDGSAFSGRVRFDEATFTHAAVFDWVIFAGSTAFERATFSGPAGFEGALFPGAARFDGTTFSEAADLEGAMFCAPTVFSGSRFEGLAIFKGVKYLSLSVFEGAKFSGSTCFAGALFDGYTRFDGAHFSGSADFSSASFSGPATFNESVFSGSACFDRVSFSSIASFDGSMFSDDSERPMPGEMPDRPQTA